MNSFVIEVSGLHKSFGGQKALDGLNLRVPSGSIFGFLGRNGAGKTTTIKTLHRSFIAHGYPWKTICVCIGGRQYFLQPRFLCGPRHGKRNP
jgi:ABC-type dipeptide/oligopeptide/nickel transport system ATPase component